MPSRRVHLRDVREPGHVDRLLARRALVHDDQVGPGGEQAVVEREPELVLLGGDLDPPGRGDAREGPILDDLGVELRCGRERRRAVLRAQGEGSRAQRRDVESRERVDRLTARRARTAAEWSTRA